jgi:hypothetical protein
MIAILSTMVQPLLIALSSGPRNEAVEILGIRSANVKFGSNSPRELAL